MALGLACAVLGACACPRTQAPAGDATTVSAVPSACERSRTRIEHLYLAEAEVAEPGRVAAAVADNTAMVLASCATDAGQLGACIARVTTAAELEATCLPPLAEDGREGDVLAR